MHWTVPRMTNFRKGWKAPQVTVSAGEEQSTDCSKKFRAIWCIAACPQISVSSLVWTTLEALQKKLKLPIHCSWGLLHSIIDPDQIRTSWIIHQSILSLQMSIRLRLGPSKGGGRSDQVSRSRANEHPFRCKPADSGGRSQGKHLTDTSQPGHLEVK